MREYCIACCLKHLSQAVILMGEAKQGYPLHKWLAIGHLAEASDEILGKDMAMANTIRDARIRYMEADEPFPYAEICGILIKDLENEQGL